jgi:hypothetical protein
MQLSAVEGYERTYSGRNSTDNSIIRLNLHKHASLGLILLDSPVFI